MDELRAYVGEKLAPDRHPFTAERGGPIRLKNWRRLYFRPAVLRSLPEEKHGLRFHDLRHTHAALLVEQGVHPKEMAEQLGHAKVESR